jgi:serine/threonine protein kinase
MQIGLFLQEKWRQLAGEKASRKNIDELLEGIPRDAADLIKSLVCFVPEKRLRTSEALSHPLFR